MADLTLGCYEPHDKQREFLNLSQRRVDGILYAHAVAGRGGGKTIAGIIWMFLACMTFNRGHRHLWTAPTYRMLTDIMLPAWRDIVPQHLYRYYAAEMKIVFHNGSEILLRSREHPDRMRGLTVVGVFHDEIAMDKNRTAWDVAMPCIRHPVGRRAGQLFCATITTPKLGWHQRVVQEHDGLIRWTSLDNPWASRDVVEQLEQQYGPALYQQEVLADWIAQHGRIWRNFNEADYPAGNIWPGRYNPREGYILACDLGIHSGWLIIQPQKGVDVVVAEYTPNAEGAAQTINRIDAEYGMPYKIIVGADVNTRSVGDATQPSLFFRQKWGEGVPIVACTGTRADKSWQHGTLDGRILNTLGDRRFCVSKYLKSHDATQQNQRGILEVMREDQWPDVPRQGEFMPKDGQLEHTRDAALYFAICQHPPVHVKQSGHPA